MSIRTSKEFPQDLKDAQAEVIELARNYKLDFFDTIFEILDYDTMNLLAAYGGFPIRYTHWRWGMEYEKLRKRDVYGMGRIYEMVINNNPCYAYLQESNSITDQKLVMAHVYAHCDFFKCNAWFSKTHRSMMDEMANHATRVQRYIDKYGLNVVERFIDLCLSIEHLIDPHSMFVKRKNNNVEKTEASNKSDSQSDGTKIPAKDYMDKYVNPPKVIEALREVKREEAEKARQRFPSQPTRDVLLFLLHHGAFEDWQRDILSMIRDEAYYFAPQAMTKIMNEGWATYWHSKIMTSHMLKDSEIIDYAEQHSGVVYMAPGGFNPYKIGLEIFKDIERRWDCGQHGLAWEALEGIGERGKFDDGSMKGREKIFDVRRNCNDVNFIDEYLTDELIDKLKMYHYKKDPRTGQPVIVTRDPRIVRQTLLYQISNMSQPYIYIVDANYHNRGELYLAHQWNGLEVDAARAAEVLQGLCSLWGRPVHLQLRVNEEMCLLSYDNSEDKEIKCEQINEDTPKPAHLIM